MIAPDKIYILMDESTGFLSHTFTNVPCEYEGTKQDIAYIRKDALLEWAKEMLVCFTPGFDCHETLKMVINHIESL